MPRSAFASVHQKAGDQLQNTMGPLSDSLPCSLRKYHRIVR